MKTNYPIKCKECGHKCAIFPVPTKKELKKKTCHHCGTQGQLKRKKVITIV